MADAPIRDILDDDVMTRQEVADFFKVSSRTVTNWQNEGIIKPTIIGGTVRFMRSEVEAMAQRGRERARAPQGRPPKRRE